MYTGADAQWRQDPGGRSGQEYDADEGPVYDLIAVANHMGTMDGGHYTADCLHAPTRSWYTFDDSRVSSASPHELCGRSAYCLFYMRRD